MTSLNSIIHLDESGTFLELWNNGTKIRIFPTSGDTYAALAQAQKYSREWAGQDAAIGRNLKERLNALDGIAFGKDY